MNASLQPHAAEIPARQWPETSCYGDLWIGLLAARGHVPEACLAFTIGIDHEGDQFTFIKPPIEDLEHLYGITVRELTVFRGLEAHVSVQLAAGRCVLLEVDSHDLPDTEATTYRRSHGKTTIGITAIEPATRRLHYHHNTGHYVLSGEDYERTMGRPADDQSPLLPGYAEIVRIPAATPDDAALRLRARARARHHLARRPVAHPVAVWRARYPAELAALPGMAAFHPYAFNNMRQLGANFELLADFAAWLDPRALVPAIDAARRIAATAKSLQFRAARSVARGAPDPAPALFDALEADYDAVIRALDRAI